MFFEVVRRSVQSGALLAALVMSVAVAPAGCTDERSNVAGSGAGLSLPGGPTIDSVTYTVLSSSNATLAMGNIPVSDPNATLSLDLILAPGTGYVVELAATTSAGASCSGTSAPFDVVPGRRTFVNLNLVCGGDPSSGSCPDIQSWAVTPVQAMAPAGTIGASVTVGNPDATRTLSYSWLATAGAFDDPSAASAVYTCTTIGSQTLTLTVREGLSASACTATAIFLVDCVSSDDAGAP